MELLKNLNEKEHKEVKNKIYKTFIGKVIKIDRGGKSKNIKLENKEMVDKVLGLAYISQGKYCYFTCDTNYNVSYNNKRLDHIAVVNQGNNLGLVFKSE